ncbi:MAG: iron chelate uptake ABC transporter family permease subunit [bacterium]|nr:iron chelate uptake ABC transporter family permease subunit [bacterium]
MIGKSRIVAFSSLFLLMFITFFLSVSIGTVKVSFSDIIRSLIYRSNTLEVNAIIKQIRLPRVILSLLVGASLGGSGAVFQSLFRNPMADAYIIGISSGSALGAVLAIAFRLRFYILGFSPIPLFAFVGGISTVFLVYAISSRGCHNQMLNLLLSGLAINSFLSSVMSFLLLMSDTSLHESIYWLMGGFSGRGWEHIKIVIPYFMVSILVLLLFTRELNLLLLGDEQAKNLGVNVEQVRRIIIIFTSLLTASAVSVSGVIGFVGLVVPHILRLLIGPDNRTLFPASLLGGSILLTLSDLVARIALSPSEIPVGIVTSLIGAPFFLSLLVKRG